MKGKKLKIKFYRNQACLTTDKFIRLEQLNLPPIAKVFEYQTFWSINVLNYNEDNKTIFCEIISYEVGNTDFDYHQKLISDKLNQVEIIRFKSIDTKSLLLNLKGHTAKTDSIEYMPVSRFESQSNKFVIKPQKTVINEEFFVPIKNVLFKNGGVSIFKKFNGYSETIELNIDNPYIMQEYDAVKNYFGNILETKKIKVIAAIEITDNEVTSTKVTSPEIEKINKELIENVKLEYIKSVIMKNDGIKNDKNVFTIEEFFETFADEKFNINNFYKDDSILIEDLLKISNTKHYSYLRFLSSKHLHKIMKLRFTHKPFSFIFLIQGVENYHFIWETLDTEEATYIWHTKKDNVESKNMLKKIDEVISLIKTEGKSNYTRSTKDPFKRIFHNYSNIETGFENWKKELEKVLT